MHDSSFRPCVLIPVYNHHQVLGQTLTRIAALELPVVLVDDGSEPDSRAVLLQLAAIHKHVQMVTHTQNRGKGGAIKTGLRTALQQGFTHAFQVDADGQHNLEDIPRFLAMAQATPDTLIAGRPVFNESVPKVRFYGRYLTHGLVWLNTLSLQVEDSMCGFRVYPLRASCQLLDAEPMGERMDFDSEFMVRWHWRHWPLIQLPTKVIYPENGISHFLMWRDNKLIAWMHVRLFAGMLWRLPRILLHKFKPSSEARPQ